MKNKTRVSLVMFGLILLFVVSLFGTNTSAAINNIGDSVWSDYAFYAAIFTNLVGLFGTAAAIATLFALHHPRSGKFSWLMPALWALIFVWLWITLALTVNKLAQEYLEYSTPATIMSSAVIEALGYAFITIILVQPIVYWAHRPKKPKLLAGD